LQYLCKYLLTYILGPSNIHPVETEALQGWGHDRRENQMTRTIPGWLLIRVAAERYGYTYWKLRNLVVAGVLTRGDFTGDKTAPIFLRVEELEAYKKGGASAAMNIKEKFEASQTRTAT
jgi:hypothetical protein